MDALRGTHYWCWCKEWKGEPYTMGIVVRECNIPLCPDCGEEREIGNSWPTKRGK